LAKTNDVIVDEVVAKPRRRVISSVLADCGRTSIIESSGLLDAADPVLDAEDEVVIPRHVVPLPPLLVLAVTKTAVRRNIISSRVSILRNYNNGAAPARPPFLAVNLYVTAWREIRGRMWGGRICTFYSYSDEDSYNAQKSDP
jgi:hypothetical protein